MRQGCSLSPLPFNTVLEVLATEIRQEKERKGIQIGREKVQLKKKKKEKVQLSLYADENTYRKPYILHTELLELINRAG